MFYFKYYPSIEIPKNWLYKVKGVIESNLDGIINPFSPLENAKEISKLKQIGQEISEKSDKVYLIGMGGSALPARAFLKVSGDNKITVVEGYSDLKVRDLLKEIGSRSHYIFVSKSGKTLEVILLFKLLIKKLREKSIEPSEKVTVITSSTSSPIFKDSSKNNIQTLSFPENISGRYSLYTSGVMLPAFIAGKEYSEGLSKGGLKLKNMIENFEILKIIAPFLYHIIEWFREGKKEMTMFSYTPAEYHMNQWIRQIFSESLGKEMSFFEPTPVCASGPYDQHSVLQQYIEGEDRRFFFFYDNSSESEVADEKIQLELESGMYGEYSFKDVLKVQKKALMETLIQKDKNVITVEISPTSQDISELMGFFMTSVAVIGFLQSINPFDQPAVELVKKKTKELMKNFIQTRQISSP